MRDDVSIAEIAGEPRGWRYHSGPPLWTERFIDGRLLLLEARD